MECLHILDGHGYIYRAYFALASASNRREIRLNTKSGMPTAALYVYTAMLIRLYTDIRPERIVVVFDGPGRTFRKELDESYKATRRETPDDLKPQLPFFSQITAALCWPVVCQDGVEADDVIAATVARARARGWDVVIYTGDKDLMQLVDDHVTVIDSLRDITYDAARVQEKFGVPPAQLRDYLSLVGDTSDNIPGMPGVGAKTAAKLLGDFGSIEGILAHVGDIKGKLGERFRDSDALSKLERSRELVTLRRDVEVALDLDEMVPRPWESARVEELFHELEFESLLERLSAAVPRDEGAAKARTPAPVEPAAAIELPEPAVALDRAALAPVLAAAGQFRRVAVHVETDGARPDCARAMGLAVAAPGARPVYLPLAHRYLGAPAPWSALPEELVALLGNPEIAVVAHDVKSVERLLAHLGAHIGHAAGDVMLAAYLLGDEGELTVEQVVADAAGLALPERKTLMGTGRARIGFESVPVEVAADRAGRAAAAVLAIEPRLRERLRGSDSGQRSLEGLLDELELPVAMLLAEIEEHGITLDVPYLRKLTDEVNAQIAAIERDIYEQAGGALNLGSPKQLGALLFDKLGLRADKMRKTKTGGFSTSVDVLENMAEDHPIIPRIIEHRELIKLKGTYLDALPPLVNARTGRIHTSFNQAVAATGRLSSQDPNLQNIPIRGELGRRIRRAFVAAPGKTLVSVDYSQIELRIMAHLSRDPVLIRAFQEGVDVHTETAAEVFDRPREQVGSDERRVAKAVNYGLMYGQSDFGLAQALGISRAQARHYMDRYFERFARVAEFMEQTVKDARRAGGAVTLMGRRRPIPDLHSKNFQRRKAAERMAQNTPVQGTAADIIKLAMLRVSERIRRERWDGIMLLTVHDELVFEVPPAQAQEFAAAMADEMQKAFALDVPLEATAGIADNWADAH
ncbi:MAG TPA: DNA polymerase I [Haliangium sp.]|nr:DNA polymerase I [Haliangium sp.]